jgi:hypothetical protein
VNSAGCAPFWCSPDGPGVPFGPWPVWAFDELRVACFVGTAATMILTVAALRHAAHGATFGQQSRWLAALIFTISVAGTELEHLGDYASWRLLVNALALALNLYGLVHFLHHEQPNETR